VCGGKKSSLFAFDVSPEPCRPCGSAPWAVELAGYDNEGWGHDTGRSRRTQQLAAFEVIEHRPGGDPSTAHKSPGRNKYV
jgi:hypothetical protein